MGVRRWNGRRAALVLAGLLLAAGPERAAAQVMGDPQRIYPGYVAPYPYPSVTPPAVVFPPGLPDPRPFELAPSARDEAPRRCVAGLYVCPASEPGPVSGPCSCPAEDGRAEGQIR